MQFSTIQLFALMAVGAMANTVAPADVAAVDAPRAPLLVRRNCEVRKKDCPFPFCWWLVIAIYPPTQWDDANFRFLKKPQGKNTQAECERFKWLTGCTWLRGSKYCSST